MPIANIKAFEYTLEYLGRCGFHETILYISSHKNIDEIIKYE